MKGGVPRFVTVYPKLHKYPRTECRSKWYVNTCHVKDIQDFCFSIQKDKYRRPSKSTQTPVMFLKDSQDKPVLQNERHPLSSLYRAGFYLPNATCRCHAKVCKWMWRHVNECECVSSRANVFKFVYMPAEQLVLLFFGLLKICYHHYSAVPSFHSYLYNISFKTWDRPCARQWFIWLQGDCCLCSLGC